MRTFVKFGMLAVMSLVLAGCTGSSIESGVPANVDMTKDYSPKVDMPGMSPKVQQKYKAQVAKEAKEAK